MLELHEIVSMSHVVACQIDFKLLCAQGQLGGVVKLTKNDYFIFNHLGPFPQVFGQVK